MLIDLGCDASGNQPAAVGMVARYFQRFCDSILATQRPRLDGAFDIPLQIVADDKDLQVRFFDTPHRIRGRRVGLWFDDDNSAESEDN